MSDYYLFRTALLNLLRPGKLVAAALLIAVPVVIGLLIRLKTAPDLYDPNTQYGGLTVFFVFSFVLTILSVIFCSNIVAEEVEQKTIVYLLTRPVPRWRILFVKYIATVLVITGIGWLTLIAAAIATFGLTKLSSSPLGRDLAIMPVGVVVYSAIFLLMGTLLNRPLILGLIYAFGWEPFVRILPGYGQYCSILTYLRILAPHDVPESMYNLMLKLSAGVDPPTRPFAWVVVIVVTLIALISALIVFSIREYVPREDAA